jgi:hypothetical protein
MTWLHNMSAAPRTAILQHANSDLELTDGVLLRLDESVKDTSGEGNSCPPRHHRAPFCAGRECSPVHSSE